MNPECATNRKGWSRVCGVERGGGQCATALQLLHVLLVLTLPFPFVPPFTPPPVNLSTNSRVVYWSFFEAGILVCMTFGQLYYLRRFFEVTTNV